MKRGRKKLYDFTGVDLNRPTDDIAKETGFPAWAVRKERSKQGIKIHKGPNFTFTRDELMTQTAGDIAKAHGCHAYDVTNARRLAGIRMRRPTIAGNASKKITLTIPLTITLTIELEA